MRLPEYPSWIQFESTIRCTSECITCPSRLLKGTRAEFMSEAHLERLLQDLADHKEHVKTIIPFNSGEPLCDARMQAILFRLHKDHGLHKIHFSTNGSLMTYHRQWLTNAYELGYFQNLVFSVDGFRHFEKVRVGLNGDEIYKNVVDFVNEIEDRSWISVHMTVCPENLHDLRDFVGFWECSGIRATFMPCDGRVGHGLSSPSPLPCSRILWSNVYILSDGTFVPCCCDFSAKHPLGNLKDQTVSEVWHGERYQELRKMHMEIRKADSPLCGSCQAYY